MLFDIDSNNLNRNKPAPNTHDRLPGDSFPARGTNSVNYITSASNQAMLNAAKNGQFTIVASGYFLGESWSVPFTSNGYSQGTFLVNQAAHNLGYTPGQVSFYYDNANNRYHPMPFISNGGIGTTGIWTTFSLTVDATNVYYYINVLTFNQGSTATNTQFPSIKYYLTQQTSN